MKKQTFNRIQEAVSLVYVMVENNQWTKGRAKYYFQTEGINSGLVDDCKIFAYYAFKLKHLKDTNQDYDKWGKLSKR